MYCVGRRLIGWALAQLTPVKRLKVINRSCFQVPLERKWRALSNYPTRKQKTNMDPEMIGSQSVGFRCTMVRFLAQGPPTPPPPPAPPPPRPRPKCTTSEIRAGARAGVAFSSSRAARSLSGTARIRSYVVGDTKIVNCRFQSLLKSIESDPSANRLASNFQATPAQSS